jgi:predicted SAM-dependent methyltransferase
MTDKLRIHAGCGTKFLKGYKHVDCKSYGLDHIFVADLREIDKHFSMVDEIYASHVLEHFGRRETEKVLKCWIKTLKKGGKLRIAVPNFDAVVEEYNENRDVTTIMGLVHGGQRDEYDIHFKSFTFESLKNTLESLGMENIELYKWEDFLPDGFDDYSRCYLPHLDFKEGRLMSLNVVASKI